MQPLRRYKLLYSVKHKNDKYQALIQKQIEGGGWLKSPVGLSYIIMIAEYKTVVGRVLVWLCKGQCLLWDSIIGGHYSKSILRLRYI